MQDRLPRLYVLQANIPQEDRPSAALGSPEPLLHELSQDPLLDIPGPQAPHSRSPSPQARRVKRSKQARDIIDLKAQMAQVLGLLSRQTPATPSAAPAPTLPQVPDPPSLRGDQGEWEEAPKLAQEDTLSIAPSLDKTSLSSGMDVGGEPEPPAKVEPSFEVASETSAPPLSDSTSALMGRAAVFLQVPWTRAAEPRLSVFRMQAMTPPPQKFPDFMEKCL
ncbi:UNVERIFIED_CONTAM: hypothetical protein FKN15_068221 [Acipenser sinensis]